MFTFLLTGSGGKNLLESFDAEHDNTLSKKDLGGML